MVANLEQMTELTKRLIGFRSNTAENANRALDFAAGYLRGRGLCPEVMENQGRRMLTCAVGEGPRCLVLNGHLDVVDGREEQYSPRVEGDRLYGRGAYDMLGACAVMMALTGDLADSVPGCRVVLSLSTTEETSGELCTGYMVEKGLAGDFAICGEPTNMAVSVMSKGVFRVKARVHGRAAHSSRPWQGDNALLKAYELYRGIEKLPFASRKNRYFDGASVNLSMVRGGVVMNQVPDYAEMVVDIRYLPGEDTGEMLRQIRALDPTAEIEVTGTVEAVALAEDDPFLARLDRAVAAATKADCVRFAQHGAADTAFFQAAGIPSVEFGPAGAGHHGPDEYVELPSLGIFYSCLDEMVRLMGSCEGESGYGL